MHRIVCMQPCAGKLPPFTSFVSLVTKLWTVSSSSFNFFFFIIKKFRVKRYIKDLIRFGVITEKEKNILLSAGTYLLSAREVL
jgi:hypothetical protein